MAVERVAEFGVFGLRQDNETRFGKSIGTVTTR
jgi:hypothetical protein